MAVGDLPLENWIPKYIMGYMIYLVFIVIIMANSAHTAINIYDLTEEQIVILSNPATDLISFLNQAIILSSISSVHFGLNVLTIILGIIWLIAVLKALKEIIPVLPS